MSVNEGATSDSSIKEVASSHEGTQNFDHTQLVAAKEDLASETKRAANLTNELEVAQMKLVQYESEVQQKEAGFLNNTESMAQELDTLRTQLEVLKQEYDRKATETETVRSTLGLEIETLQVEVGQQRSDKEREDTENTIIMKLLHVGIMPCKLRLSEDYFRELCVS